MSPTLYHVPRTISSPIVQILHELNAIRNGQVIIKTLSFADLKTPEYLSINPMGTSPAFTDDEHDVVIWESGAIVSYVLHVFDTEYKLHPRPLLLSLEPTVSSSSSHKELATFLHLQQYITATVYPFLASLLLHTLRPEMDQDPAYVSSAKEKFDKCLGPTLSKYLVGNNNNNSRYFTGDSPSAIDYLMAKPLGNAYSLGLLANFPLLDALLCAIRGRTSYALAYNENTTDGTSGNCECRSMVLIPGE